MIALFQANTKIVEMYIQQLVRTNTFLILHRLCRDKRLFVQSNCLLTFIPNVKLYVSSCFKCVLKLCIHTHFTSMHLIRHVLILCPLVTFCLKWWDGWVPQSNLLRNSNFLTRPVFTPTLICLLALPWKHWPSSSRYLPQSIAEKRSFSCGSCHVNRRCQFAFNFTLVSRKTFVLRNVTFEFSSGI